MAARRWKVSRPPRSAYRRPKNPVIKAENVTELQLENSRLRRLVTDLLLEKVRLEEMLNTAEPVA